MRPLKAAVLILVVISQVFYVKYVVLRNHAEQKHDAPPPNYRVLTDGKVWVWESRLSPEFPDHWIREIQVQSTKQDAIESAWGQHLYYLHEATNKWHE